MELTVKLDYKRPPVRPGENRLSDIETTANYMDAAVSSAFPEGLEEQMRRIYGRIQRKVDEASEKELETITLEEAEKDLLRKALDKCKIPASFSKYFVVFELAFEESTNPKMM